MAWTKRKIIDAAHSELRLSGYVFDMSPEEIGSAGDRLEAMMASVEQDGVQVGYVFGDDLDAESGVPMHAIETVFCTLACRLATNLGKEVRAETMRVSSEGLQRLRRQFSAPRPQAMAPVFGGAGQRGRYIRPVKPDPIGTNEAVGLTFTGTP